MSLYSSLSSAYIVKFKIEKNGGKNFFLKKSVWIIVFQALKNRFAKKLLFTNHLFDSRGGSKYPLLGISHHPRFAELVDRMQGTGWVGPPLLLPPPIPLRTGHFVIEPMLDFAHFWLRSVATGSVLRINQD